MAETSFPTSWPTPEALKHWQQQLRSAGERRLVLVEVAAEQGRRYAAELFVSSPDARRLWVGESGLSPSIKPQRAPDWLGRELDLVVWDGWLGNPPDGIAALLGTLGAGGLFVWLMPPLDEWPGYDDPDYRRTGLDDIADHPFARRLAGVLQNDPQVVRLGLDGLLTGTLTLPVSAPAFAAGDTEDQLAAIDAIYRTGLGRRRRPLILRADRGRGKSTALGRAAAQLLHGKRERIVVTAPSAEAVEQVLTAAQAAWPQTARSGTTLAANEHSLKFVPPDVLLRERPEAGLVLVDEAAGLPAPVLESILTGWPRVVFSTTVHGYEGTGRGFDVRFRDVLDRITPQWQELHLRQPIRWIEGDPLERLTNRLFLLDAESASEIETSADLHIEHWQPAGASETELAEAFGLLTDAHYRTTPGDLRQWLDDPNAETWLARSGGAVVGVLWISLEGGLSAQLAEQVMRGERRIRGHLLAQGLASHGGLAEAASLSIARVVRIAVHPGLRRRRVGRTLLEAGRAWAVEAGCDLFGTSFGATSELLSFWRNVGLEPLRLGLHQSASSGEHTLQMAVGCSEAGNRVVHNLKQRFAEHWPLLLASSFSDLEPGLTLSLTEHWLRSQPLAPMDHTELAAFADGYRLFELSRLPLQRLSRIPGVARSLQAEPDGALWCHAVLQGWSWAALQAGGLCTGRRDGETRLRCLAKKVIETVDILGD